MNLDLLFRYIKDNYSEGFEMSFDELQEKFNIKIDNNFIVNKRRLTYYGFVINVDYSLEKIKVSKKIYIDSRSEIVDIKGTINYCIIKFSNGDELKCSGELMPGREFIINKKYINLTDEEIEIFISLLDQKNGEGKVNMRIV